MSYSAQQLRVINHPNVSLIGHDDKGRPVVQGMFGIPQQKRTWALNKAGDPVDISGAITHE